MARQREPERIIQGLIVDSRSAYQIRPARHWNVELGCFTKPTVSGWETMEESSDGRWLPSSIHLLSITE
jgi:hypothetical protein